MNKTAVALAVLLGILAGAPALAAATLSVGTVSGSPGQTVTVPVSVDTVSNLLAVEFSLTVDTARLAITKVEPGALAAGFSSSFNTVAGVTRVAMASGSGVNGSGVVANVTISITSGAPAGSTPVTISGVSQNDQQGTGTNGSVSATGSGDGQTLLLQNGRVSVTVTYRNQYNGQSGVGAAIPQNGNFGYFFYADRSNPEVFVKVLDFGEDRPYLLFTGGLTDFEVHATFTVLRTGQAKTLDKPAGSTTWGTDTASLGH
jgi:hypothetical protein